MNNMFEYLSGGQCYTCGGKVRYALGGNAPLEEEQNPIADMSNQGQQIKQPTTLDANAKQLMKFLLEQLSKGTSERILKKTLVDSGVKSEQATQLLEVAKKEFTKITEQGDYVNEMARQRALQEEQAAALQNQMGMFNANDPMGMNPQAGEDPSLMAMQQGANQSQMGDQEMEAQGRYGGSMKRLRRYGAGGLGCPDGFNWDEMTAQCMPSSVTANTIAQGSGAMQFGAPQAQPNVKAGIDAANGIAIARAQATDARSNAKANFYGSQIANYDTKRAAQKDQFNTTIGDLYGAVRTDQTTNPQNNIFQSWQNINNPPPVIPGPVVPPVVTSARDGGLARFFYGGDPNATQVPPLLPPPVYQPTNTPTNTPIGVNQYPAHDFGRIQDQGNTMGRWGGMKQYGAGGTEDGCPIGYYKDPNTGDCLKIFGSDQSKQEYQTQVKDFYYSGSAPDSNMNRAPMQTYDEFIAQNPAQDQMYTEMKTSPAAYQSYINQDAKANTGNKDAATQLTYEQWKAGVTPAGAATDPAKMPTDPRLTNSPYIVQTDKNKIANIDSNWATRAMAIGNTFGDSRFAPITGGFGPALKFLTSAAAVAGGVGLGFAKGFAGDESRVYDDKGNTFFYNSKGDERRALRNGQQKPTQAPITPAPATVPGSNNRPTQEQIQQYQNSQLRLPGQAPINPVSAPADPVITSAPADNSPVYNPFPPQENPTDFTPGPDKVAPSQSGPLQSDDPNAPNYNPNVPKVVKEDGGEWNPFVDNRRKLKISMPMYTPGGAVDTETTPYTQQEWATKTSRMFPLNRPDNDAYNTYVANFNNPANANAPGIQNTTDNTNNALSANPSATKVDTKEYVTQRGDPLGFQVASNILQGANYMNDAAAQRNEQKTVGIMKDQQRKAGNSMAMGPINTQGSYGTWNLNAGPGANQYVADLGHTQDWGTQLARFGGTKSYRRGGTYEISPEDLKRIIEMGGEVEFLD